MSDEIIDDTDQGPDGERERRWRLVVGGDDEALSAGDQRLSAALTALYGEGSDGGGGAGGRAAGQRGGLGRIDIHRIQMMAAAI